MIETSSSDELRDLEVGSSWLMVEKGPEVMGQGWEEEIEIQDYNLDWDTEFEDVEDIPNDSFEAYSPYDWSSEGQEMSWSL